MTTKQRARTELEKDVFDTHTANPFQFLKNPQKACFHISNKLSSSNRDKHTPTCLTKIESKQFETMSAASKSTQIASVQQRKSIIVQRRNKEKVTRKIAKTNLLRVFLCFLDLELERGELRLSGVSS